MNGDMLPSPSRGKLALFSFVATLLFFAGMEGIARMAFETRCGTLDRLEAWSRDQTHKTIGGTSSSLSHSVPMPYDPYLIWHLIPRFQGENLGVHVFHNSAGLRSPEIPRHKPEGTRRILLLGDSTTYGHGVRSGFTLRDRLEQGLREALKEPRIEVINGGVPGYSSLQSLNLLKRIGIHFEPDVVVILNLWSDCIFDRFTDESVIYGEGWTKTVKKIWQSADEALAPRSALYCVLKTRVFKRWQQTCQGLPPLCAPPPEEAPGNQTRDGVRYQNVRQPGASTPQVQHSRVSVADYTHNLEAMTRYARRHGAEVVFVNPAIEYDIGRGEGKQPTPEQFAPYRRALAETASRLRVPLVDMAEAFRAETARSAQARDRLFMDIVHPTEFGDAVMTDALLPVVEEVLNDKRKR